MAGGGSQAVRPAPRSPAPHASRALTPRRAAAPQKESLDELGFESSAFETLERDFQEVLTELVGDKSLEKFRHEYEKLHRALKKSHESEKRLIKKCRELNTEIVSNATKVQTALKLSQEDQNTIASLKREIEKAWKMVDASHEKESRAKETISQLKTETSNLSRLVEQGTGLSVGQENTVNELLKDKDTLSAERNQQVDEIAALRGEISLYLQRIHAKEQERAGAAQEISTMKELISSRKAEAERETRRKERLEKETKDMRHLLELRAADARARSGTLSQESTRVERLEEGLRAQRVATEKWGRELDAARNRLASAEAEARECVAATAAQQVENNAQQGALRAAHEEGARLQQDLMRQHKLKDAQAKSLKVAEGAHADVKKEVEAMRSQTGTLERELKLEAHEAQLDRETTGDLAAELAELKKLLGSSANSTQRQVDILKLNTTMIKSLEGNILGFKQESTKQRKMIYHLEKEREKSGAEASDASAKFAAVLEEVKLREMTILDLQKKIAEGDVRLKQQQNQYEAVRSDRNLYSKNLIESQDEIAEMKRKFKIMNHQIEQLKEEIQQKDNALVKEHIEHTKADKEREALKNELVRLKKQVASAELTLKNFETELAKLNHIINEADADRFNQKKEYDITINERDILGTQLIRRNDELALLYQKVKIQQETVSRGEVAYRDKVEDLRVLNLKHNALRRELHIQKAQSSNLDVLRAEVYTLQRELLQDRTKVKALSEELEDPNNTYRWRKLEGSDPGTYEMLQKIQALQKRLISKTEEVVEKDLLIQEKDRLYVELKNILARQPGPEVTEQLSIYQQSLRYKTKSMKAMASELNMYQAQINEHKFEMERLTRELQDMKRQYYEQKRRETLHRELERGLPPGQMTRTGGM